MKPQFMTTWTHPVASVPELADCTPPQVGPKKVIPPWQPREARLPDGTGQDRAPRRR